MKIETFLSQTKLIFLERDQKGQIRIIDCVIFGFSFDTSQVSQPEIELKKVLK